MVVRHFLQVAVFPLFLIVVGIQLLVAAAHGIGAHKILGQAGAGHCSCHQGRPHCFGHPSLSLIWGVLRCDDSRRYEVRNLMLLKDNPPRYLMESETLIPLSHRFPLC